MSKSISRILKEIQKESKNHLFAKIKEIVKDKSYEYLKGIFFVNDLLIINIGENQSIHIYPLERKIFRVDHTDSSCQDYDSQDDITVLNAFFSEFLELFENSKTSKSSAKVYGTLKGIVKKLVGIQNEPCPNAADLFFKTELWYYKSLLSLHIANYCFRKDGQYRFKLPNNTLLHLYISRVYMTDEGIYIIEKISDRASVFLSEADCQPEILSACKYLTSDPAAFLSPK